MASIYANLLEQKRAFDGIRKVKFNSHWLVWNTKKVAVSLLFMSCENALHWSYENVADHIHGNWLNLSLYKEDKVFRNDVSDVVPADDPVLVFCYIFFWQKAVDGHPSDLIPTSLQVPFLASLGGLSGPLWISGPTVLIYWKKHERFSKNKQGFFQSTSQLLAILRWFGKRGGWGWSQCGVE